MGYPVATAVVVFLAQNRNSVETASRGPIGARFENCERSHSGSKSRRTQALVGPVHVFTLRGKQVGRTGGCRPGSPARTTWRAAPAGPLTSVTHRDVSDSPGESMPCRPTDSVGRPWVVYGFSSTDRRRSVYTFTPTFETGTKIKLF